mmetsp:Transcript_140496/g.365442  ORF Transcript_140496/g.365442 Transcript_140496/m.365442 type:complete len:337 (-) Transcript_140496:2038-3048(-)
MITWHQGTGYDHARLKRLHSIRRKLLGINLGCFLFLCYLLGDNVGEVQVVNELLPSNIDVLLNGRLELIAQNFVHIGLFDVAVTARVKRSESLTDRSRVVSHAPCLGEGDKFCIIHLAPSPRLLLLIRIVVCVRKVAGDALKEMFFISRGNLQVQSLLQDLDEAFCINFAGILLIMGTEALLKHKYIFFPATERCRAVQLGEHSQRCSGDGIVLSELPHVPDDPAINRQLKLRIGCCLRPKVVTAHQLWLALHFQPSMLCSFCRCETLVGILAQQRPYKVLGCFRDALPALAGGDEAALANLGHDIVISLSIERGHTTEQHVNNDTDRPHVTRQTI